MGLIRACYCLGAHIHAQDTSVADHLHYLGIEFGAAELEGQIAELEMRAMAVKEGREEEVVVVMDWRDGVAVAEA